MHYKRKARRKLKPEGRESSLRLANELHHILNNINKGHYHDHD